MLEDCLGQKYRRRHWTLCVKQCSKCVRRLPWSKISTSTLDFVCKNQNVLEDCLGHKYRRRHWTLCVKQCSKCVRRLPWPEIAGPARISAIWTKFDFSEIELESLNARNTYPNALKFLIFWLVPIEIII